MGQKVDHAQSGSAGFASANCTPQRSLLDAPLAEERFDRLLRRDEALSLCDRILVHPLENLGNGFDLLFR